MIGTHLGERYELTMLLGEGPIFSAYSARDKVLSRDVSVRIVKPPFSSEPSFLGKVREVIRRTGVVEHPSVERMLDLQQDPNVVYLVSEPSKGSALVERIRKLAPYSVPVSVAMTISILEGLDALHGAGLVHGDPGAHNVVVLPDGTARLQLPGMWEAYAASDSAAVMLPAMAPYLAPEVSAGERPSPASDSYAVGIILFQLLTGRYPYTAETPVAMAMRHASVATPSAKSINSAVPAALDDLIKKALAKDPSQRYADAAAMLADLRRIEDTVRFGKSAPVVQKPAPVVKETVPSAAPAAAVVVPKADRREERRREKEQLKAEREPGDVPIWMLVCFTFVLAVAVALVGVWWFFNMNAPKVVKVPDIKGKPRTEAEDILRRYKLQIRVAGREPSEKIPMEAVMEVNPEVGQQVREGGTVAVKLSAGSRLVMVPDLRGRSLDQARDVLTKMSLDVDNVQEEPSQKVQKGLITRQDPVPQRRVERMSRINLWVSSGSQGPGPTAGNAKTRYLYTMRIRLTKITEPVVLRVDITDANGTRSVYEQQHYPDQEVTVRTEGFGQQAIFRIYYNDELVTQVTKQADEAPSSPPDSGNDADGDTNA